MDRYLVHGNDYKAVRDAVGKAILESKPLAVEAALEVGQAGGCSVYTVGPHSPSLVLLVSREAQRVTCYTGSPMSMACELPWKTGEWQWLIWVAGFVRANQQLFSDSFRSFFF